MLEAQKDSMRTKAWQRPLTTRAEAELGGGIKRHAKEVQLQDGRKVGENDLAIIDSAGKRFFFAIFPVKKLKKAMRPWQQWRYR